MAVTKYAKSITTHFTGLTESNPNSDSLTNEIDDSDIATSLSYIDVTGDDVDIWFVDALSAGDQTILGTVVAAHTGVPPNRVILIESNQLVGDATSITEDQTWQEVGGQPTNIDDLLTASGFLTSDKQYSIGRITCEIKVSGTGAELKIVECAASETDMMSSAEAVADTSEDWVIKKFITNVTPSLGDACYCLRGRLNGATSMEIRRAALTMLYIGP